MSYIVLFWDKDNQKQPVHCLKFANSTVFLSECAFEIVELTDYFYNDVINSVVERSRYENYFSRRENYNHQLEELTFTKDRHRAS